MSVAVNIPGFMQDIAGNTKVAEVTGGTVGVCLTNLVKKFPRLQSQIFDKKGQLHSYLDIYINRKSSHPQGLAKPVNDGDKLDILNIILGG